MGNKKLLIAAGVLLVLAAVYFYGCQDNAESIESYESQITEVAPAEPRDTQSMETDVDATEHEVEVGAEHEEGEESGEMNDRYDTIDQVRHGVRLVLAYNQEAEAFLGSVENTTQASIENVRIEVHLSNGTEIGPSPKTTLDPGETKKVKLEVADEDFVSWNAHVEVGSGEHN